MSIECEKIVKNVQFVQDIECNMTWDRENRLSKFFFGRSINRRSCTINIQLFKWCLCVCEREFHLCHSHLCLLLLLLELLLQQLDLVMDRQGGTWWQRARRREQHPGAGYQQRGLLWRLTAERGERSRHLVTLKKYSQSDFYFTYLQPFMWMRMSDSKSTISFFKARVHKNLQGRGCKYTEKKIRNE